MPMFYSQEQYDEYMSDLYSYPTTYEHEVYLEECRRMTEADNAYWQQEAELYGAVNRTWDAIFQIVAYLAGQTPAQPDFRSMQNDYNFQVDRQTWKDNGEIPF